MDKLDHIFELQKGFQDKLKRERGLEGIPMETWLQKQTLAMISELAELLRRSTSSGGRTPTSFGRTACGRSFPTSCTFLSACASRRA